MKVFKSSTHSYPLLTKLWISQSVFHQLTWSLAHFEGVIEGYKRPVFFNRPSAVFWFLNMKDQDCSPVHFPVQSGSVPVFFRSYGLDLQTLTKPAQFTAPVFQLIKGHRGPGWALTAVDPIKCASVAMRFARPKRSGNSFQGVPDIFWKGLWFRGLGSQVAN